MDCANRKKGEKRKRGGGGRNARGIPLPSAGRRKRKNKKERKVGADGEERLWLHAPEKALSPCLTAGKKRRGGLRSRVLRLPNPGRKKKKGRMNLLQGEEDAPYCRVLLSAREEKRKEEVTCWDLPTIAQRREKGKKEKKKCIYPRGGRRRIGFGCSSVRTAKEKKKKA